MGGCQPKVGGPIGRHPSSATLSRPSGSGRMAVESRIGQAQRGGTQAHHPTFFFPTHLPISYHTHVHPRGGVAAATARRQPGVRGLVGAPGRARGGRLPNRATSAWLPKKVPSACGLPYLVTCLLSRRLGLIYSYSSPVQRAQPTADPLCGASILAHGGHCVTHAHASANRVRVSILVIVS